MLFFGHFIIIIEFEFIHRIRNIASTKRIYIGFYIFSCRAGFAYVLGEVESMELLEAVTKIHENKITARCVRKGNTCHVENY